jgi:hypothetical protein
MYMNQNKRVRSVCRMGAFATLSHRDDVTGRYDEPGRETAVVAVAGAVVAPPLAARGTAGAVGRIMAASAEVAAAASTDAGGGGGPGGARKKDTWPEPRFDGDGSGAGAVSAAALL